MAKIAKPINKKGTKGTPTRQTTENLEDEEIVAMNFKVEKSFRKEFRTYASEHDISMTDLFKRSFEAYKESR